MSPLDHQAIHRSVSSMAFRLVQQIERKRDENASYRMQEVEQQFQVEFSAETGGGIAWAEVTLPFDHTIFYAPGQRDNDNDEPQVWFGKVIDYGPPVVVDAHVSDWDVDDAGHFTAATIMVGIHDPNQVVGALVRGRLHVTIQGLGAPADANELDGEGE